MGDKFYAVAHGRKPGVYEEWVEAEKQCRYEIFEDDVRIMNERRWKSYNTCDADSEVFCLDGMLYMYADATSQKIKDYLQPVYKKFATRDEAEEFVKARQHERISMQVDESAKKFYAVARGKVIGIFTEFDEVKKHITNYPQPMYKKFDDLAEARQYFKKYSNGEHATEHSKLGKINNHLASEEKEKEQKKSCAREHGKGKDKPKHKDESKEKVYYAVARGHKPGVYETWAECQEQTKEFKGAKFKKFTDEEEAKLFAEGKTLKQIEERKRAHENDAEEEGTSKKPAKGKLDA